MALHIALGFTQPGPSSPVEVLYAGYDADAARDARDTYNGHRTSWLRNPEGLLKLTGATTSAQAEAQAANERALAARNAHAAAPAPTLDQQLAKAQSENAKLARKLAEFEISVAPVAEPAPVVETLALDLGPATAEPTPEPVDEAPASTDVNPDAEAEEQRQKALAMAAAADAPGGGKKKKN